MITYYDDRSIQVTSTAVRVTAGVQAGRHHMVWHRRGTVPGGCCRSGCDRRRARRPPGRRRPRHRAGALAAPLTHSDHRHRRRVGAGRVRRRAGRRLPLRTPGPLVRPGQPPTGDLGPLAGSAGAACCTPATRCASGRSTGRCSARSSTASRPTPSRAASQPGSASCPARPVPACHRGMHDRHRQPGHAGAAHRGGASTGAGGRGSSFLQSPMELISQTNLRSRAACGAASAPAPRRPTAAGDRRRRLRRMQLADDSARNVHPATSPRDARRTASVESLRCWPILSKEATCQGPSEARVAWRWLGLVMTLYYRDDAVQVTSESIRAGGHAWSPVRRDVRLARAGAEDPGRTRAGAGARRPGPAPLAAAAGRGGLRAVTGLVGAGPGRVAAGADHPRRLRGAARWP